LREEVRTQQITIQTLEGRLRGQDQQKRLDELMAQINNISKERDLIRSQYESIRLHLEE
jgi:hypothetical protein